jgi:hypothetical protein
MPIIEEKPLFQMDNLLDQEQTHQITQAFLQKFDRLIRSYAIFTVCFLALGILESVLVIVYFTALANSSLLSFGFATFFLTLFSYFIFRIYFQTTLPEKFEHMRNKYLDTLKNFIAYCEGVPEHHIALAISCSHLSDQIASKDSYYRPPKWLSFFSGILERFSYACHWQDLLAMREMLLMSSISEHIQLVRLEPSNLEYHSLLANAYVRLSLLYADLQKQLKINEYKFPFFKQATQSFECKFKEIAEKAVEELKILNEFAPNDPWVHQQLAFSYHDLNMAKEEIIEYEILVNLNPEDWDALYKLGALYFQAGMNAKGLKIYEELKHINYKKANALLKLYGC